MDRLWCGLVECWPGDVVKFGALFGSSFRTALWLKLWLFMKVLKAV